MHSSPEAVTERPLDRPWPQMAVVAVAYALTGWLGVYWALPPGVASSVWPPSGIALAAVLIWGPRVWPGIAVGSVLVNIGTLWAASAAGGHLGALAVVASIAAGSTLQALAGAWAVRRWTGSAYPLATARGVFVFAGLETLACVIAATVGALSLTVGGLSPWAALSQTWTTWWLGDLVGTLVAAPLCLILERTLARAFPRVNLSEFIPFGASFALLAAAVFGCWPFAEGIGRPVSFLLVPALVWGAFRFGPQGSVTGILVLSAAALAGTSSGKGPFGASSSPEAIFQLQSFLGVLSLTSLVIAGALEERREATDALRRAHAGLEITVRQRTDELRRANTELEAFGHSVAHDLRAPLRSMSGYAGLLLGSYSEQLDDRGRHFLDRIIAGAERMSTMIDDLLNLSMVSQKPLGVARVSLSELAGEIADDIKRSSPPRAAVFEIAPGLAADGDEGLLRLVLTNLLSNAWKFTAWRPEALIEFGTEQHEGYTAFFVRDNGAGFDMREAGRLFHAFERLHPREEFSGTGVGLATVRRIIERHGGKVCAHAELGRGASFYFSLPGGARQKAAA